MTSAIRRSGGGPGRPSMARFSIPPPGPKQPGSAGPGFPSITLPMMATCPRRWSRWRQSRREPAGSGSARQWLWPRSISRCGSRRTARCSIFCPAGGSRWRWRSAIAAARPPRTGSISASADGCSTNGWISSPGCGQAKQSITTAHSSGPPRQALPRQPRAGNSALPRRVRRQGDRADVALCRRLSRRREHLPRLSRQAGRGGERSG